VPFIIALGFVTAGVTLMLVERFGHRTAYFIVAPTLLLQVASRRSDSSRP
jgi:hypothetical protein